MSGRSSGDREAPSRKRWKDPSIPGVVGAGGAALWWVALLATVPLGLWGPSPGEGVGEVMSTILLLLPWVAVIAGIVAIRRSKPHPAVPTNDPRPSRGRILGWIGVLAGGVAPFFMISFAFERYGL